MNKTWYASCFAGQALIDGYICKKTGPLIYVEATSWVKLWAYDSHSRVYHQSHKQNVHGDTKSWFRIINTKWMNKPFGRSQRRNPQTSKKVQDFSQRLPFLLLPASCKCIPFLLLSSRYTLVCAVNSSLRDSQKFILVIWYALPVLKELLEWPSYPSIPLILLCLMAKV